MFDIIKSKPISYTKSLLIYIIWAFAFLINPVYANPDAAIACERWLLQYENATLPTEKGTFTIRKAIKEDIPHVAKLIRESYAEWKKAGLSLPQAIQTEAETENHLKDGGFVIRSEKGDIVGTITFDFGLLELTEDVKHIKFTLVKKGSQILYTAQPQIIEFLNGDNKLLVVYPYRLAIHPEQMRLGLGRKVSDMIQSLAVKNRISVIALETSVGARWLFDWYERLGFKVVGSHLYVDTNLDTVLMLKNCDVEPTLSSAGAHSGQLSHFINN